MGGSENYSGVINTRETPSATDVAVALVETLIDDCIDRETLRKKFMERFGGDRHAARTYFSLALRRLVNAGKVVVAESGGSEVICRSGELTKVIKKWGDLIEALTWRSEGKEVDPDVKTNGRIIVYLVRHGMMKALTAFLCRDTKVWAYIDDPIDLSLILDALFVVLQPHGTSPEVEISPACTCSNGDFVLFVPRRVLLMYMAAAMKVERDDKTYKEYVRKNQWVDPDKFKVYTLKLPGGRIVRLKPIPTDCIIEYKIPPSTPTPPEPMGPSSYNVLLKPAVFNGETLPLIIRFVRVLD
ncbi:MAG: hypothetical protein ACO2PN_21195 [Pyrobaculum sp.]|jgi:hypothetical protein